MPGPFTLAAIAAGAAWAKHKADVAAVYRRLLYSSTAEARGLDNTPDPNSDANLRHIAPLVLRLQKLLRSAVDPSAHITSGYRAPAVNAAVGGVASSRHQSGLAVDFGNDWDAAANTRALEAVRLGWGSFPPLRFVYAEVSHLHVEFFGPGEPTSPTRYSVQ